MIKCSETKDKAIEIYRKFKQCLGSNNYNINEATHGAFLLSVQLFYDAMKDYDFQQAVEIKEKMLKSLDENLTMSIRLYYGDGEKNEDSARDRFKVD
jgi:hypothetical protein